MTPAVLSRSSSTFLPQTVPKIICRVFPSSLDTHSNGGNPLTVFLFDPPTTDTEASSSLQQHQCQRLAQECEWESVMVSSLPNNPPNMSFYMPSGEEVRFCAHAAMGACWSILRYGGPADPRKNDRDPTKFIFTSQNGVETHFANITNLPNDNFPSSSPSGVVELKMDSQFVEEPWQSYPHSEDIMPKLLSQIGISPIDIHPHYPFCNSSISRNKTLIPIRHPHRLQSATSPNDPPLFRSLCDALHSTGIYLYTPLSSPQDLECRQFPRASGYPEDPATGIAAGALVRSWHSYQTTLGNDELEEETVKNYTIFQGRAMGRPSQIRIRLEDKNDGIDLYCSGMVNIDSHESVII